MPLAKSDLLEAEEPSLSSDEPGSPECVCCGSERSWPYISGTRRCVDCRHTFVTERGDPDDAGSVTTMPRALARRLMDKLSARHAAGSTLLEIGSAPGEFFRMATEYFAAAGCFATGQRSAAPDYLGQPPQPRARDIVCLWHALDLFPNPADIVRRVREELRPGGTLALLLPDMTAFRAAIQGRYWRLLDPALRLHYFSPASARRLLGRCGYTGVEITHPGSAGIPLPFGLSVPFAFSDQMLVLARA